MNYSAAIPVTDPWGLTYTIYLTTKEEATRLIQAHNGKELTEYSNSNTQCYYLDNKEVICINHDDADIYSSFEGFLSNRNSSQLKISKKISLNFPITRICYLPNGRKINYHQIDPETGKILANSGREIFYDKTTMQKASELDTHKILLTSHDNRVYYEFQNKEDVEEYINLEHLKARNFPYMGGGRSIEQQKNDIIRIGKMEMCGRNPYAQEFTKHVDSLVAQLPELIGVPIHILNYSKESLAQMDVYLYKHTITPTLADMVFLPLLAYIGETYKHLYSGDWLLEFDLPFNTWIPCILDSDGRKRHLYTPLLHILDPYELDECGYTALASVLIYDK